MCYWIIPANGNTVTDTTVLHLTRDDMADPARKEMIIAFNNDLTNNLDDSNFDYPTSSNFI